MHVNMGQERSLFFHNIATNMLYNRGQSTGSKSSFTADHIQNQGTLSGTQKFYLRSKTVNNTSKGHIKGTHALIDIEKMEQRGEFIAEEGRAHIGAFQDSADASTTLNHSVLKGQILHEEGDIHLNDSKIQVDAIDISDDAHPELIDSFLIGQTVTDRSHLSFGGDSGVMADDYQHQGFYAQLTQDGKKSTFSVKAKTAHLQGGGDLENAVFEIDHFVDSAQLIAGAGAYSNYHIHQSLGWSTLDDVSLTNPISRDCDITVQAASIENQFDYNQAHQLSFISTVGDITFSRLLQGSNVYAYSARDILNRGQVLGTDKVFFQAGRNVENRGRIASGKYTQILAKGNVTNLCEEEAYQGQWDVRRNYKAAVITGGTGEDTEGVGLHIEADGEVISDASDFVSQGSNYIQGKKGVHFGARYRTYTSLEKTEFIPCGDPHKRFWRDPVNGVKVAYGKVRNKKIETIAIDIDVGLSHVVSGNGRNIIRSGEGEISSTGAQFVSPGGTDVYARGDVKLYGLQLNNKVHQNTNYRISIFNSSRDYYYQQSQPTLFVDNGTTRIHSSEGNVDARGAYFIGGGDLEIKAKKQILLGVDILNNEITEKTQSFGWSMPGKGAWDTYKQGGKIWDIGAAFDPSLGKANALYQNKSDAERLASAANLGIDLANTGNSLMRGIAQGNITDELLARYGLGHDGHFAPSVSLSFTQRKTKTRYQTQAQGGIDRGGNLKFESGEGLYLDNGVGIYGENIEVKGPRIVARGATLQSSIHQKSVTGSVGVVGLEGFDSFGVSISQTKTSSTSYVNAVLSARNKMSLHNNNGGPVQTIELDSSNLDSKFMDANVETVIIIDHQDTSQTQKKSASVVTNGMFGAYQGKGQSKITQQHSGIHVSDGINTNGHEFVAHETHMVGGKISTEGENHFKTDILTTETLVDVEQYSGFGISGNLHDAERLLGGKPANRAGEPMITTASVQIDRKDFVAIEKPVIHGKQGTELSSQSLEGQLESQHDSGRVIQKDHSLHVQIDIPVTNHEFLTKASDNVHGAKETLSALLHPKSQSQKPMAFGKPEPIVPVEDENSNTKLLPHRHRRRRKSGSLDTDENMGESSLELDTSSLLFSSNDTEVMHRTVTKAQHEYRTSGKLSDSTKHKLKNQVIIASAKIAKAYGSEVFDEMVKATDLNHAGKGSLSDIGIKEGAKGGQHFRKLGLLWKLWMNEELTLLNDEVANEDKFKHGLVLTAMEYGFDFALERAFKKMAGPLGVALTLLDISDSFYDEDVNKKRFKQGLSDLSEAHMQYREGNGFRGWLLEREAIEQINAASRARASHEVADLLNTASKPVVSGLNSLFKQDKQKLRSRDDLSVHIDTTHNVQSYMGRARSGSI